MSKIDQSLRPPRIKMLAKTKKKDTQKTKNYSIERTPHELSFFFVDMMRSNPGFGAQGKQEPRSEDVGN